MSFDMPAKAVAVVTLIRSQPLPSEAFGRRSHSEVFAARKPEL